MILNARFEADWNYIRERKVRLIKQNNARENKNRLPHTYQVGDRVKVLNAFSRKHGDDRYLGPFTVHTVYDNGTLRLMKETPSGGATYQQWNVRNVAPYEA